VGKFTARSSLSSIPIAYFEKKDMHSFGLYREDSQGKENKRLGIKEQMDNPCFPRKMVTKMVSVCVYVCVCGV